MIDTGQVYHATLTVKDITGTLVNATTVTLTITLPDGTTATPTVDNPPATTGQYTADYATTQPGLHKAAWATTAPGTAATDYFNVRDFASVLSLAEAKAHLSSGSAAAWTADDDELRNFLQAVTEVVESKAGPCVRRSATQLVAEESAWQIVLNERPVLSVESVTSTWPGGPVWTTSQLDVDTDAGIVNIAPPQFWPFYLGPWNVAYTVGRVVVPERLIHGAKELLRHLWESQRGQLAAPILGGGETVTTSSGMSFSVPYRVLEMLADDMTPAI